MIFNIGAAPNSRRHRHLSVQGQRRMPFPLAQARLHRRAETQNRILVQITAGSQLCDISVLAAAANLA